MMDETTTMSEAEIDQIVFSLDLDQINQQLNDYFNIFSNGDKLRIEKAQRPLHYYLICYHPVTKAENQQEFFLEHGTWNSGGSAWVHRALIFAGLLSEVEHESRWQPKI